MIFLQNAVWWAGDIDKGYISNSITSLRTIFRLNRNILETGEFGTRPWSGRISNWANSATLVKIKIGNSLVLLYRHNKEQQALRTEFYMEFYNSCFSTTLMKYRYSRKCLVKIFRNSFDYWTRSCSIFELNRLLKREYYYPIQALMGWMDMLRAKIFALRRVNGQCMDLKHWSLI